MHGIIKVGQQDVEMLANAATPIRYNNIFKDDFFASITGNVSDASAVYVIGKLAYVMAMQAAKTDMTKLSEETYMNWLERFEADDLFAEETASKIMALYEGNAETKTDPK